MSYEYDREREREIERRRRRRRKPPRRVRYDRIIGVAAIFIVILILFVSCVNSCGSDDTSSDTDSAIVPTSDKDKDSEKTKTTNADGEKEADPKEDEASGDMEFTTISAMPNDIYKGDLIVVNKNYSYSFPTEEESTIKPIYELASGSYQYRDYVISLSEKTINAINQMMDAYYTNAGNNHIMVINGFKTKEEQDAVTDTDIKGGYSEYHTGMNFDLGIFPPGESSYYYTSEGSYSWISENLANYGFILRYPEGKEDITGVSAKTYKFRYVGTPHALYMAENNLCLEEYIDEVKNYTSDGEHIRVSGGEAKYEIYYVPADPSANTEIPVPADKHYTISGNNIDGFIVTVEV